MFDYYRPQPSLACPACGATLNEWQGYDGPCGLFVWEQGTAAPIDQVVSLDVRLDPIDRQRIRLPGSFLIRARCCSPQFAVEAVCRTHNGVWETTAVTTAANATQHKEETRAAFAARLKWLSNAAV
jgi:hypothetical protein